MPTYEYECPACEHKFERFQSMTDRPVKTCPECKKRRVKRLIGAGAGLIFKGSGFYATDYRSDSYKKSAAKEKPSSNGGSDKSKNGSSDKSNKKADSPTSSGSESSATKKSD